MIVGKGYNGAMSSIDLHCHSNRSDGTLSPAEVVVRAARQGVTTLALTDHDSVAGLDAAAAAAESAGVRLITGIELSASWRHGGVHIVALDFDPQAPALRGGLQRLAALRETRGEGIGRQLERAGISGALAGARQQADGAVLCRLHFARHLQRTLHLPKVADVFRDYLRHGKPGYVDTAWPALEEVAGWVHAAGGICVVAHPMAYGLTGMKLRELLGTCREAGVAAIEVATARIKPADLELVAKLARRFGLAASLGSDFHDHTYPWVELGRLPPLPAGLTPVTELFGAVGGPASGAYTAPRAKECAR